MIQLDDLKPPAGATDIKHMVGRVVLSAAACALFDEGSAHCHRAARLAWLRTYPFGTRHGLARRKIGQAG